MPLEELIESIRGFHALSYYAGITTAFAEVVGAGCKSLALSSPYDSATADMIREPTRIATEEYNVKLYEEKDLLVTRLFPADIAAGKTVFLIARDDGVLQEYMRLKEMKKRSDAPGNPDEAENQIAWRFGRLLSYSERKIGELLSENS
jgi:hypothetical protein